MKVGHILKNRVVWSCQSMVLVKSLWGLPSVAFKILKEESRHTHMKSKTGTLGARGMFSLAKMLLKYLNQF